MLCLGSNQEQRISKDIEFVVGHLKANPDSTPATQAFLQSGCHMEPLEEQFPGGVRTSAF